MKALKMMVILAAFGLGMQAFAGTGELIASMKKQQRLAEKRICDLWSANERGKELEQVLSEYVVREVRLRSVSGTNHTGTLISEVLKGGEAKFKSPKALAQAIVLVHLRRTGIRKNPDYFVRGRYLIKNCDIRVVEEK